MKEIKIKSVGLSITTFIVSGLALTGWATSKEFKDLCLVAFFSSSTTGLVAATKSKMDERDVNEKVKKITENILRGQADSDSLVQKSAGIVSRLSADLQASEKQLEQSQNELQAAQTQLQITKDAFTRRCQELAQKAKSKDGLFNHFLKEYVTKLSKLLITTIQRDYTLLVGKCDGLLKRKEYEKIHAELEAFKASLGKPLAEHVATANEIAHYHTESIDSLEKVAEVVEEIHTLAFQVIEEISAHKVRHRNILNIDERRALSEFYKMEPNLITKQYAIENIREQSAIGKEKLDELHAKINEHGEEIERDRREFMEVLKQLETANERVALLSQPMLWEPAIVPATKVGNILIQFFQQQRIHLDRSHWTGDKHEAILYFHTTRINPAQRIDIKSLNEHGEYLGQYSQCLKPIVFAWDWEESHMLTAKIVTLQRPEKAKEKESAKEELKTPLAFLKPTSALSSFVEKEYHVGLWGSSGTGKTTAISNIIGLMIEKLGGSPEIHITIPKIDGDIAKLFPRADWADVTESVFGLLEAALEIQFRMFNNKVAYRENREITEYAPVLFFIDEINMIFTRWRSISDADLENVFVRFEATLSGDRLAYFQDYMKVELVNYKGQFAKKLLYSSGKQAGL